MNKFLAPFYGHKVGMIWLSAQSAVNSMAAVAEKWAKVDNLDLDVQNCTLLMDLYSTVSNILPCTVGESLYFTAV